MTLATKACELSEWKEGSYLDTLAAAFAESGDWENAVKHQQQAIELATDEEKKQGQQVRLEFYKTQKPYREGAK